MSSADTPPAPRHRPGLRLLAALCVGLGLAAAGYLVGQGMERFRMADRGITVKGLAERDVPADHALWNLNFRRASNDPAQVQAALAQDREKVLAFLREQGFEPAEIDVMPL